MAGLDGVVGARRRRRRPRPPPPARRGGRRADRPPRQQRERARPQPAAGAGELSARGAAQRLRGQRVRPARPRPARPPAFRRGRAGRQRHLRRRRRGLRDWGGYGSSKAALVQLTAVLAAENPTLRVYAVDPGDMRTQMQQEAFPGEDISDRPPPEESVPGLLDADRGRPPERALSGPRPGRRASHERACVRAARPPGGARAARSSRPRARRRPPACRRSRRRARSSTAAFAICRGSSLRAICSSSTRRRPFRRRFRRRAPTGRRSSCGSRRPRPAGIRPLLDRGAPPRQRAVRGAASRRATGAPGRRNGARSSRRTPPRGSGSRASIYPGRSRPTSPSTGTRFGTATCRDRWPLSAYQNVYAAEAGSAEMPSAGRPFTPELITRLVAGGVLVAPITLHTGVSSQERDEPPYPERFRVPRAHGETGERRPRVGRAGDRRRDDRRSRPRDGRRSPTAGSRPARDGRTSS